ncbi:hypothetical protein SORBI_3003G416200 [Sorghum bicolor]|uniref:NADH-ubiquinone oxidoreductase chain 3 n=1 Tax=Sorghum bicolor TaxID=4558 RepID=C5XH34_SORBI|nr:hypothetical protein SORBI_3003G416200 [Sorghum bicolor]
MFALVFVVLDVEIVFLYRWAHEFRRIVCIHFYRSFHFCAYPSCWFSLCMAKRSLGMVLTEYSEKKKEKIPLRQL